MNGDGTMSYPDGRSYKGQFKDDFITGTGGYDLSRWRKIFRSMEERHS